mmetsp:Transcript_102509/g.182134  ORF Transcript_102509/g.182134 Transcript_102509/m.182134 type:complete len:151 (-) Transcript_102509:1170-1622(-)
MASSAVLAVLATPKRQAVRSTLAKRKTCQTASLMAPSLVLGQALANACSPHLLQLPPLVVPFPHGSVPSETRPAMHLVAGLLAPAAADHQERLAMTLDPVEPGAQVQSWLRLASGSQIFEQTGLQQAAKCSLQFPRPSQVLSPLDLRHSY